MRMDHIVATGSATQRQTAPAWLRRIAWVAPLGAGLAQAGIVAVVLGCALLTYRQIGLLERADAAAGMAAEAERLFARQHTLAREYRITPGEAQRSLYEEARAAAEDSLRRMRGAGIVLDPAAVEDELALDDRYNRGVARLFSAVDAGNAATAQAVEATEVSPGFLRLSSLVRSAAARLDTEARTRVAALARAHTLTLVVVPLVLLLGIGATALSWLAVRALTRLDRSELAARALEASDNERRARRIVQAAPDLMLVCAANGLIRSHNLVAATAWRFKAPDLVGHGVDRLVHPSDRAAFQVFWETLAPPSAHEPKAAPGSIEVRLLDGDGAWRRAELTGANLAADPDVEGVVLTLRDASRRVAREGQGLGGALHDPATQLPNEALFQDRLEQALLRAGRTVKSVGLMLVELDAPRTACGRLADRALLIEAAARLRTSLRVEDTVAVLEHDRLAVVLDGVAGPADLQPAAERVARHYARPFGADLRQHAVGWSIGMAAGAPASDTATSLLAKAEVALDRARVAGDRLCVTFEANMRASLLDRVELESDLGSADLAAEMRIHFQPIMLLESGRIEGVEALVRWLHPVHGMVAPQDFMPIAEESGLILPLGRWMLTSSCQQVVAWQERLCAEPPLVLHVNLSARQFADPALPDDVADALASSGLDPDRLVLEVSEDVIMRDVPAAVDVVWRLKGLGVRLAMDGFGLGSATLSYMRQLPLDLVKIDSLLVRGMHGPDDAARVQASVALARSLEMRVAAVGIETPQQAGLLRDMRCELGQGHFYGRAMEVHEAEAVLMKTRPERARRPVAVVMA